MAGESVSGEGKIFNGEVPNIGSTSWLLVGRGGRGVGISPQRMKSKKHTELNSAKAPSGIIGFDEMTGGGLPRGRTTLLMGGPGSGKTIFALQFLAHGARDCGEPGVFVAFEETPVRLVANFEGFGWNLTELRKKKLFFLDAQPKPDLIQSGSCPTQRRSEKRFTVCTSGCWRAD